MAINSGNVPPEPVEGPSQKPAPKLSARELGDTARDRRDWRRAAVQYQLHLQAEPQDFDIWVQCGHAEKESGDLLAAERCYRIAEALRPDDADLQLQLGHLHKLLGRFPDAARCYARALDLDPRSADARRELAQPMMAALLAEHVTKAAQLAARSPAAPRPVAAPPPADAALSASNGAGEGASPVPAGDASPARRSGQAVEQLRAQVTREPTNPARWLALAEALEETGDAAQAKRCRDIADSLVSDDE